MPRLDLLTSDAQPALGKTHPIPSGGLVLTLRLPAVSPARLEPTQALLTLKAPPSDTSLSSGSPELEVVTDLGPPSTDWSTEQSKGVKWLTANWGSPRSLLSLLVSSNVEKTDKNARARLKVFQGGTWFPVLPLETVPLNTTQPLPGLVASRLMVELVQPDANGVLQPTGCPLQGPTFTFSGQPQELSLAVKDQAPCYQRPGRLLPGKQATVDEAPLLDALRRALAENGSAADIPLTLRDAVQGRVTFSAVRLVARTVHDRIDTPLPDSGAPLDWYGEAVGQLTLGEGVLEEVRFTLVPQLVSERLRFDPQPSDRFAQAQLCAPQHSAAQGFAPLSDAPLAGLDVWLQPLTSQVSGTLALHPDDHGIPGLHPYTGTSQPFALTKAPSAPRLRLVPYSLPKQLGFKDHPWWLVLTVTQGEALWPVVAGAPPLARLVPKHRVAGGSWSPWTPPPNPEQTPWAPCRLRTGGDTPLPVFTVKLRRGGSEMEVPTDAQGRVHLTREHLTGLASGPTLTLAVSSPAVPVRGAVGFKDLRISII